VHPKTLDHVALWAPERDAVAAFAERELGMHVIERTDRFTLVGADARRGKLTLFEADGPREPGALKHVALRVAALAGGAAAHEPAEGLSVRVVEHPTDLDYDLDHVALLSADPEAAAADYVRLGFRRAEPGPGGVPRVEVGGAYVELHAGDPGRPERPLLHHLAVLVDSAAEHRDEAERLGFEIDDWVDAPNTLAVFVAGPDRVRIEYVEHKPGFALV
jgi:catechol 2,3-dioxygenase-like lactoylglutathione lyase family enzyme